MTKNPPCWSLGDDVQSFQYYSQQLLDLWPQKAVISGFLSAVCSFFYADAVLFWLWFCAILCDFILGACVGIHTEGHMSLDRLQKGIVKFVTYLFYVIIAAVAGVAVTRSSGIEIPVLNVFMGYLTLTELKSIIKNMGKLGFKVPPLLMAIVGKSTKKLENTVDKINEEDK